MFACTPWRHMQNDDNYTFRPIWIYENDFPPTKWSPNLSAHNQWSVSWFCFFLTYLVTTCDWYLSDWGKITSQLIYQNQSLALHTTAKKSGRGSSYFQKTSGSERAITRKLNYYLMETQGPLFDMIGANKRNGPKILLKLGKEKLANCVMLSNPVPYAELSLVMIDRF